MTRIKSRFPRDVRQPIRFFGIFTVKDLARVGVPIGVGAFLYGFLGAVAGVVTGIAVVAVKPSGATLDTYLYRAIGLLTATVHGGPVSVDTVHDTAIELSDGTLLGVVKVSAVDVEMRERAEQKALQHTVRDLFQATDFPIRIESRQRRDSVDTASEAADITVTDHYITVGSSRDDPGRLQSIPEDAVSILRQTVGKSDTTDRLDIVENRCQTVTAALNAVDMEAEQVTGDDLTAFADRYNPGSVGYGTTTYTVNADGDETHRRTLYVDTYPAETQIAWLADVLAVDGSVAVTQSVAPADDDAKTLTDLVGRLRGELGSLRHSGVPRHIPDLQAALDDAEWMLDLRSRHEETLVEYGVAITAIGPTPEAAKSTLDNVKTTLRKKRIQYHDPHLATPRDAAATTILQPGPVPETMIVPSTSAAAGFPFATRVTIESGGIVFGHDPQEETPIILDRYAWDAGHIARMGATGSGKSYAAKLEILRSLKRYNDLQVYLVDPKQEYGDVADAVDATTVVIDEEGKDTIPDTDVLRFTVTDRSADNTNRLTETVRSIYRQSAKRPEKALVVVDEAHRLLTDSDGVAALSTLVREARDTETAVTLITQNASDFTRTQEGRDILKNVPCTVFMRHTDLSDGVAEFFNLSSREAVDIRKLRTGTDVAYSEAIVRVSGVLEAKLRITAAKEEAQVIDHNSQPPDMTEEQTQSTMTEWNSHENKGTAEEATPDNVETTRDPEQTLGHESRSRDGRERDRNVDGFKQVHVTREVIPGADTSFGATYARKDGDPYMLAFSTYVDGDDSIIDRLGNRSDTEYTWLLYPTQPGIWTVAWNDQGTRSAALHLLDSQLSEPLNEARLAEVKQDTDRETPSHRGSHTEQGAQP